MKPLKDEPLVRKIQAIRSKNNVAWMGLVRLALRLAPKQARAIFRKIEANDAKILREIRKFYGPNG
jgi:hypothetical protein